MGGGMDDRRRNGTRKHIMEICMEYGYPILRHTTAGGAYEWYYPEAPTDRNNNIVPRLVKGTPYIHIYEEYMVCTFQVNEPKGMPVIILSVKKIKG
jgi:hypothetical protein